MCEKDVRTSLEHLAVVWVQGFVIFDCLDVTHAIILPEPDVEIFP